MPDGDNSSENTTRRSGFSRRGFLGAGAGGLASAVVLGAGVRPAAAVAGYVPQGPLNVADPHAATRTSARVLASRSGRSREGLQTVVYPITRATFRPGAFFDLRVEVAGVDPESARVRISVQGPNGPAGVLTGTPVRTSNAPDSLEVEYEDLAYPAPGTYTVSVVATSRGSRGTAEVTHEVLATNAAATPAKNIIFFLGDGMGAAAITGARILSKGIEEGKYNGLLEMDQMDFRGLVTTSGVDSIATDSANSMSAYTCGHKSSVNAMGVYAGNNEADPNDHPRVETVAEILKRARNMAIGVVTTSEIQDATPAAVWAHTRRRSEYLDIMDQALTDEQMPDVLLGGGRASLLPQGTPGSRRNDSRNLIEEFQAEGFAYAPDRAGLQQALAGSPEKLLGLFRNGNMDVYVDREITPENGDPAFPDQPTLMEMTDAALQVLARRDEGFFLMVEAASIDKMEHPLDGPRAVYDTIEFDQAVGIAKRFAEQNGDTLIVITADHNHSMSIVGTHDRRNDEDPDRQANGVYADAGFPTYSDPDGDGFPDDPNAEVQLFFGWSNHPDHTDDFEHNPRFLTPALIDANGIAVPNPARDPDALVQIGNLPYEQTSCVHTVEDVYVIASGPGSSPFNGVLDNTDVFHRMVDAIALEIPLATAVRGRAQSVLRAGSQG